MRRRLTVDRSRNARACDVDFTGPLRGAKEKTAAARAAESALGICARGKPLQAFTARELELRVIDANPCYERRAMCALTHAAVTVRTPFRGADDTKLQDAAQAGTIERSCRAIVRHSCFRSSVLAQISYRQGDISSLRILARSLVARTENPALPAEFVAVRLQAGRGDWSRV